MKDLNFDENMLITDEDTADRHISDETDGTVVSYVAVPTEATPGSYCYKMLIDSRSHELYYFKKHRITKKTGTGFLAEDIRRISSARR